MKKLKLDFIAKQQEYETRAEDLERKYEKSNCKIYEPFYNGWCFMFILTNMNPFFWFDGNNYSECKDCEEWHSKIPRYRKISRAFQLGIDWFEGIDEEWLRFIGAYHLKEYKRCTCFPHLEEQSPENTIQFTVEPDELCAVVARENEGGRWLCTSEYYFVETITPSDGIVLVPSQRNLPDMTLKAGINPLTDLRLDNTSHMQVRNNSALKEKLRRLYDGDFHNFFKTEEKQ